MFEKVDNLCLYQNRSGTYVAALWIYKNIFSWHLLDFNKIYHKTFQNWVGLFVKYWLARLAKTKTKAASKLSSFFDVEKQSKPFLWFWILFVIVLGSLLINCWKVFNAFLWRCLGDRSGTAFGSTLESFWTDVGNMFGVMLDELFEKTWFYQHNSSFFESFYLFIRLFPVGRHFKNNSFTCIGAQLSSIRLRFLLFLFYYQNGEHETFVFLSFSTDRRHRPQSLYNIGSIPIPRNKTIMSIAVSGFWYSRIERL